MFWEEQVPFFSDRIKAEKKQIKINKPEVFALELSMGFWSHQ
ncbi:MAG: hypothetical protein ACOC56_00835 [Atribacterota bacterium]